MSETFSFIEPDGTATLLPVSRSMSGRFMPPVALYDDPVPSADGTRLRALRFDARTVVVPIWIESADIFAHRAALRDWARRLNPRRGDGKLRVAIGSTIRDLIVRYREGFALEESYPHFIETSLAFYAADPYWADSVSTSQSFGIGATQPGFLPLPHATTGSFITLGASTVSLAQAVVNAGDVEAWPVWTITGPATSATITNSSTGQELMFTAALLAGESVIIDTRPGIKSVRKAGVNRFDTLSAASVLWALQPGTNTVTITLPNATGASSITMSYAARWLAP